uniref:Secreted protein n=1 Tax=Arundo donax TaxID=35708 RepID=A0A0A9D468_ARUDO
MAMRRAMLGGESMTLWCSSVVTVSCMVPASATWRRWKVSGASSHARMSVAMPCTLCRRTILGRFRIRYQRGSCPRVKDQRCRPGTAGNLTLHHCLLSCCVLDCGNDLND